jgi:hypothetical protein
MVSSHANGNADCAGTVSVICKETRQGYEVAGYGSQLDSREEYKGVGVDKALGQECFCDFQAV